MFFAKIRPLDCFFGIGVTNENETNVIIVIFVATVSTICASSFFHGISPLMEFISHLVYNVKRIVLFLLLCKNIVFFKWDG